MDKEFSGHTAPFSSLVEFASLLGASDLNPWQVLGKSMYPQYINFSCALKGGSFPS